MKKVWLIVATIFQSMLAMFLFMAVVFSAASIFNNNDNLTDTQKIILDGSMFALPLFCILITIALWVLYSYKASAYFYWLNVLPLLLAAAYFNYAISLT